MFSPLAHAGHVSHFDLSWPSVAVLIVLAGLAVAARVRRGRAPGLRVSCLAAGLVVLAIVISPPLDSASGRLLSAHMAQHMLLMLVVAPLLVLGRAYAQALTLVPRNWRPGLARLPQQAGRMPYALAAAGVVFTLALWLWHLPALYDLALRRESVHLIQHATFLAAGFYFWYAVLIEASTRHTFRPAAAALVFATMLHSNALGALLVFSNSVWYSAYAAGSSTSLGPLEDQQLAGAVMWVCGVPAFLGVLLWLGYRWLSEDDEFRSAASTDAVSPPVRHSATPHAR